MLGLYDTKRRAAIHQYGTMARSDHGLPLSEGRMPCQIAGEPVIDND
jgi:hypothetical protein